MFPLEVLLLLKVGAGPGSVGKSAVVSLLDWYDLGQEVVLVLERPVPSEDLLTYISNNDGSLDENTAKVLHLCSYVLKLQEVIKNAALFCCCCCFFGPN